MTEEQRFFRRKLHLFEGQLPCMNAYTGLKFCVAEFQLEV